jgi:hypothetical protein
MNQLTMPTDASLQLIGVLEKTISPGEKKPRRRARFRLNRAEFAFFRPPRRDPGGGRRIGAD